jgi:hypothetical protein
MVNSMNGLLCSAYGVISSRLRMMRDNYRSDSRAGEFWAKARQRVCGKAWVKSQVYWWGEQSKAPVEFEFKFSRAAHSIDEVEVAPEAPVAQIAEFAPSADPSHLLAAVEVA